MIENPENENNKIQHPEKLTHHDINFTCNQAVRLGCRKYIHAINALYTEYHNWLFDSHESAFQFLQKEFEQRWLWHQYSLYADQEVLDQPHSPSSKKHLEEYFSLVENPYVFVKSIQELSPPIQWTTTMNDHSLFWTTALAYVFILKEANAWDDWWPKTFNEMIKKIKWALTRKKTWSFASYNEDRIVQVLE